MSITRRGLLALAGAGAASIATGSFPDLAEAATSPYRVIRRFAVVQGLPGGSRKLVAAPRRGGGFFAFWEQSPDGTLTHGRLRAHGRNSSPLGPNTAVTADTRNDLSVGTVVPQPDGSAAVFSYGRVAGDRSEGLWWMTRVNVNGRRIGSRVRISAGRSGHHHHAVRLADGRMVCTWDDNETLGNFAKIVTPAGSVIAETTQSLFHNTVESIAPLPRAKGAVLAHFWSGAEIAFHIVDATLTPMRDPIILPALMGYEGVRVAPHPAGFAAVWIGAAPDGISTPAIEGAIFSAAGDVLTRLQRIPLAAGLDQNNGHELYPALLTLPDGRLLFARNRRALDPKGRDLYQIMLHLYDAKGRPAARPAIAYQARADFGEFFVRLANPRSLVLLSDRSILLTYDTGPWGGPHVASAVNFTIA
jgi:hypothetical protein